MFLLLELSSDMFSTSYFHFTWAQLFPKATLRILFHEKRKTFFIFLPLTILNHAVVSIKVNKLPTCVLLSWWEWMGWLGKLKWTSFSAVALELFYYDVARETLNIFAEIKRNVWWNESLRILLNIFRMNAKILRNF